MRPTEREQIIECINELEKGQLRLEDRRESIWQDKLIWWICKALCLLLVDALKRKGEKNEADRR